MGDRIKVASRKGYTVLQNTMILDKQLSLKTKGLMAVILSRPDDWEFSVGGLAVFCGCGKDAIRGALKELEQAGYLTRQQLHGEGGAFSGNLYEIHDSVDPIEEDPPLSDNPTTASAPLSGKPSTEKPSTENPTQRNKDLTKEGSNETPYSPPGGRRAKSEPKWMPDRFEAFWAYYREHARGEDRAGAIREWDRLKPDDALIRIMGQALRAQVASEDWKRGIGVPYACRWLRNRRWEDKLQPGYSVVLPSDERRLPTWD